MYICKVGIVFLMFRIGLCEDQPISINSDISGTALSVFFIFFFLGIGSFMKEINKKLKVLMYDI